MQEKHSGQGLSVRLIATGQEKAAEFLRVRAVRDWHLFKKAASLQQDQVAVLIMQKETGCVM